MFSWGINKMYKLWTDVIHYYTIQMLIICKQVCACRFSYHILQVNEGVIDGHNIDAFLKAGPQDQTANTTETAEGGGWRERERERERLIIVFR